MMRALSVLQPWAWAIAEGHKRIENRDWPPPHKAINERLAIHASKKPVSAEDRADFEDMLVDFVLPYPRWEVMPYGAIVALATVRAYVDQGGALTLPRIDYRWFNGPYGWVLADVVRLPEPVPARGALGLWKVPLDIERLVLDQAAKVLR